MIIELQGGSVFSLKNIDPIDTSIYNEPGGWNAEVIRLINDPGNKFHRPGNGLDFYENDIIKIIDELSGEILIEAPKI